MNTTPRFLADTGERMARTFVQAYVGAWMAAPLLGGDTQWDTLFTVENLKYAVVVTLLALATALGAKGINNPDSASVLPPQAQPPAPQPADPTLKPEDAAPPPAPEPETVGLDDNEQLAELLRQIQIAPPPAPAPPVLAPPPVARPLGLLDPSRVGGRDPLSEGIT
jgi:hypothetical protein